ncbi:MAG: ATP-binding protein [Burkholderiaceae bacterium]
MALRPLTALAPLPFTGSFDQPHEEVAFRGDFLRGGRPIALALLILLALLAAARAIMDSASDPLSFRIATIATACCAAGAGSLAVTRSGIWADYRNAVFLPLLSCACGAALLLASSQAADDLPALPALLIATVAAVALLCRLLIAEVVTLCLATSAIMLITDVFTARSHVLTMLPWLLAANAFATWLALRIESRERANWTDLNRHRQELRRLRRDLLVPTRAPARPNGLEDATESEMSTADVDVVALVREVLDSHRSAAERAGIALVLSRHLPTQARARTNALGLTQVVSSLVSNAVIYGALAERPRKRVVIGVLCVGERIRISVIDNGIGIAPELHRRVFDAYYRSAEVAERTPGAGLGLYFAARVIQRLDDHRMQLRSQPGSGTRVNIHLPRINASLEPWRPWRPPTHSSKPPIA